MRKLLYVLKIIEVNIIRIIQSCEKYKGGCLIVKRFFTIVLFSLLLIFFVPIDAKAQEQSIQEQIKASQAGQTIQLNEGVYEESIVIDKAIRIVGTKDVTLSSKNSKPAITINSNHVVIENINIKHDDPSNKLPAILINGHHNSLQQLNIDTNSYGIQLDEANENILSYVNITGEKDKLIKDRQHGINIWKSQNNKIHHSTMSYVQDGIYIERSQKTKLYNNTTYQSRYGYHLMFTKNTVLKQNASYENVSGMMVMGADGTIIRDNTLTNNQKNVQSLGLLLFDTINAIITENNIVNNRIGVFIEDASNNEIALNNVRENYIGLQLKSAENNNIINNTFVANVVQGQAKDSSTNYTNNNYWGDHFGIDVTGDNVSNLTYKVNPFFLNITNEYPPFQLLFQSPGMFFLEQLIHIPNEQQLVDESPLMENPLTASSNLYQNQFSTLLICISIFILSIVIIYLGVKINEKV